LPFTPLHMGAVLIVKPSLDHRISLISFGVAQIAMDLEPGIRMLVGADEVLHGVTHTILGTLIIAFAVVLLAPPIGLLILKRWNREARHYKQLWLVQAEVMTRGSVVAGALFGTLSHVALDSLIHHDIQPLFPFSRANPMLGLLSHDTVYLLCFLAAPLGAVVWVIVRWRSSRTIADGVPVRDPVNTPPGFWKIWVWDLRATWFCMLLVAALPGVLYGAAFFAILALVAALLLHVPRSRSRISKKSGYAQENLRRLSIAVLIPAVTLAYVFTIDKQIPKYATPIVKAIESFRAEEGHYPTTLEALRPGYLTEVPSVRTTVFQPQITYRVTDGKPHLSIPSANGDAFAAHEYDFNAKAWVHYQ